MKVLLLNKTFKFFRIGITKQKSNHFFKKAIKS